MYLKRIEAIGFKSFADKTIINFEPGIIGVVGPNGSGKSNISDSIKWVLGESSMKAIRGKSSDDIIFAGSSDKPALNMAEVTIVFDNTSKTLDIDFSEVSITRKVFRGSGENEYYLNGSRCRKKDILDLLMDTGLGRNSLALISQGTVSQFAEAKPEDRRALFEEAAGVAKYKQRKVESLRKLERTADNLDKVTGIINELSRQITPLKRQAENAEVYLEKKKELEEIEVGFIVEDVKGLLSKEKEINGKVGTMDAALASVDVDIATKDNKLQILKNKVTYIDKNVDELQSSLLKTSDLVTSLEAQKIRSSQFAASSSDAASKAEKLKKEILELRQETNLLVSRNQQSNNDRREMANTISTMKEEINSLRDALTEKLSSQASLKSKRDTLAEQFKDKTHLHPGVRAIVRNNAAISGFVGLVQDVIKVPAEYEVSFNAFARGLNQQIILNTSKDVKNAINFLKNNRAGKATFLPVDGVRPKEIRDDLKLAIEHDKGFVGIARDLVEHDKKIQTVVDFLFASTVIADSYESAERISKLVKRRVRVVSLDGQVINAGGSVIGGSQQRRDNSKVNKNIITSIDNELLELAASINAIQDNLSKSDISQREFTDAINQKDIANAKTEQIIASKESRLNLANDEFEKITGEKLILTDSEVGENSSIIEQLNSAVAKRENITEELKSCRAQRFDLSTESDSIERSLREQRVLSRNYNKELAEMRISLAKYSTHIENQLQRLNEEYKMTYEHASESYSYTGDFELARLKIKDLRAAIESLGNVNLDAIEEYKNVSERFESLSSDQKELDSAKRELLKAIDEMDEIMITTFKATIESINHELQTTFTRLFGGGEASISYSDPENILESGIEINVQPPGKKITNMNLFSGGEKSLIALSVLFAILKHKPLPLCFLDEVEAPLDQANVERFAKYLGDFTDKTQFIVITHRPGTMEQCDMLYGVTMQTKGVTKMVSVKLDEAEQLVH